jgi:chromosome partitioning protein
MNDNVSRETNDFGGQFLPHPLRTRIFTVANQKGGVGKTTSTVNLAAALAEGGLHILVIDLDPQGNASTALAIAHHQGVPDIYATLVDNTPMSDVVQAVPHTPNLWCAPATIDLAGAEIELVSMLARESRLIRAITAYEAFHTEKYGQPLDYIFIDCPPSLGLLTINALVAAREVLVPIQCEYYALEGLGQLRKTIELVSDKLNTDLKLSTMLLTMYDSRTRLAQDVVDDVKANFPVEAMQTLIPRSVRISEAPSRDMTVIGYDRSSPGSLAYIAAARELAYRAEGLTPAQEETVSI